MGRRKTLASMSAVGGVLAQVAGRPGRWHKGGYCGFVRWRVCVRNFRVTVLAGGAVTCGDGV